MADIQQGAQGVDAWPVLHLTPDVIWKRSLTTGSTTRADFDLAWYSRTPKFWYVMDLPGHQLAHFYLRPDLTTGAPTSKREDHTFIHMFANFSVLPLWPICPPEERSLFWRSLLGFQGTSLLGG